MNNVLIKSQSGYQVIPTFIGIGRRQEVMVIGDKLKELMDKHNMSEEDLVKKVGNSYRNNITRILNNQEIPNPKMVKKLEQVFEVEKDHFKDKELENTVCVQGGNIVGVYDTNKRALEVKEDLLELQKDAFLNNKSVFYEMPEK